VWNKPSPHTQNTTGKQPKIRKQTFPKPQVWCASLGRHTHTKRKKRNNRLKNKRANGVK
jgi:hypothetical protein